MERTEIIAWLLEGDAAIQYQTRRDLLHEDPAALADLRNRIVKEGWGRAFLERQQPDGHWGRAFYQPKWASSHYTLVDLRNLCIPATSEIKKALALILATSIGPDGGINPSKDINQSDVCINGMFLNYACYFGMEEEKLRSVIDFIISQQLADGGFNCRLNRSGARHSSMHSTISVLEGIREYIKADYAYRAEELKRIEGEAQEFLLRHRLYKSDHTGAIIHQSFLKLVYPPRWRYDILRALDYFQSVGYPYDERLQDAVEVLKQKRLPDGRWKTQAHHPGEVHFLMEQAGKVSRWNTLRCLRVLEYYNQDY
ncbi:prenyltransferase/squalene oxidase repeat-containing protein [Trichococcus alkaliphilus]|uniref:prenyltransferase/squalene oxidase repeat-containing protein n=1 Tax=Trichococcus alkaliphilus TaxID=2052943 RepID=UPI000D0B3790|nr:prenyltransferase/squalene oxidase repeat-containing protein [Trichococcus alkaliphilus]